MIFRGTLVYLDATGKIVQMELTTHTYDETLEGLKQPQLIEKMTKNFKLKRFEEAYIYATRIIDRKELLELGKYALFHLEIEYAIRIYRLCVSPDMVFALNSIKHIEEKNLLSGHVLVLLNRFDEAQVMFLASSCPNEALSMRRDLMHWDSAMKLAKGLAFDEIPYISYEYGKQLEFVGDHPTALKMFEKGITKSENDREHNEQCACGIARTSLKIGDIRRGVELAIKLPNKQVKRDCGAILESIRQYAEAGNLYEIGEAWDKAALVYIKSKNWTKVGELLPSITSPKIHSQYGKAREADGYYKDAYKAYMNAKEYENAIRIQLDFLKNPEKAVKIVKDHQSIEGAKMIAVFFQKFGDYASAVQFLVMSKCTEEAFQLARMHGLLELYAESLGLMIN
jgi:WD repeat-containing protein 19